LLCEYFAFVVQITLGGDVVEIERVSVSSGSLMVRHAVWTTRR
jgi:hypothetical protein